MTAKRTSGLGIILTAGLLSLGLATTTLAQAPAGKMGPTPTGSNPDPNTGGRPAPDAARLGTLNSDTPADKPASSVPVNPAEEEAYKSFTVTPNSEAERKISIAEDFDKKYPSSRYRPVIYSTLTMLYLQTNQVEKMEEVGEKEVILTPTDVQTMAILGQTIPRAMNDTSAPNAAKELSKAEDYSKRAIEVTPTIPKPANLTDAQFAEAKNTTLAMAHSGLGLVYVRRGKYADAIPELDQSVKLDPTPDPVNYYLLGVANEKASHFEDAAAAFNKCAAIPSGMQDTCKSQAVEAKKLGSSQLSVPK